MRRRTCSPIRSTCDSWRALQSLQGVTRGPAERPGICHRQPPGAYRLQVFERDLCAYFFFIRRAIHAGARGGGRRPEARQQHFLRSVDQHSKIRIEALHRNPVSAESQGAGQRACRGAGPGILTDRGLARGTRASCPRNAVVGSCRGDPCGRPKAVRRETQAGRKNAGRGKRVDGRSSPCPMFSSSLPPARKESSLDLPPDPLPEEGGTGVRRCVVFKKKRR